jgi:hypothetical protein
MAVLARFPRASEHIRALCPARHRCVRRRSEVVILYSLHIIYVFIYIYLYIHNLAKPTVKSTARIISFGRIAKLLPRHELLRPFLLLVFSAIEGPVYIHMGGQPSQVMEI